MPKLVVKRTKGISSAARKFKLLIDGQEVGEIANGSSESYDVPAGQHTLNAKIQWLGSKDFELSLNDNETKYLKVGVNPLELIITLATIVVMFTCIAMQRTLGKNAFYYAVIPIGLYRIYSFTIARNSYLVIKEDDYFS